MMMLWCFIFLLLGSSAQAAWKLAQKNVCFHARDSKFGTFTLPEGGFLNSIKLVHQSGHVTCRHGTSGYSNWGCATDGISVAVTDLDNVVLFPDVASHKAWFTISGFTSKSKELVFDNPAYHTHTTKGQVLRLWYLEDLRGFTESDNSGRSCADVYVDIDETWKLQKRNVCFRSRDTKFGTFTMKGSGTLNGIKLVHKSGYVSCRSGSHGNSNWGCATNGVSTVITDSKDTILFPKGVSSQGWYTLPGFTSKSPELVLNTATGQTEVNDGQLMKVWYGEDLKGFTEADNHGEVCADVYAEVSDLWKVQGRNVCFRSRDSKFGTFTMKEGGVLNGIKLVHKSGYVSCRGGSHGNSNWGCATEGISTVITDSKDKILFPKSVSSHGWYTLSGFTSKSPALDLDTPTSLTHVSAGQSMKVWYGEDLKGFTEGDNHGEVCVDVYADVTDIWKIQQRNVCFETRGNKYGTFTVKNDGLLNSIKLVHKSGSVSCRTGSGESNWGCATNHISMVVTNNRNGILFPSYLSKNGWYSDPLFTSMSQSLRLEDPSIYAKVRKGQELRLWYGEDLRDKTEGDNRGKVCADVYADIQENWKLQQRDVCFETRGDKPGTFKVRMSGNLKKIKLVHKSGFVACYATGFSNFGCAKSKSLSTVVTDDKNKILFPDNVDGNGWYKLPGYSSQSSTLVLDKPAGSVEVQKEQLLKVWYGEDLKGFTESDNHGRACVDVYADIQEETRSNGGICQRDFKKIGCYRRNWDLVPHLLVTDLDPTHKNYTTDMNWEDYTKGLHSIACRCRELAKKGNYKYFAIGFHGECVSGENVAELDKMFAAGKEIVNGCINGNWGTCSKSHEAECTGTGDYDFFYQVL